MKSLPSVLAFQRSLVVGDALFYSVMPNGELIPVPVIRHGIRGTQNQLKAESAGVNLEKEGHAANIQDTDSAKLSAETSVLRVVFSVKGLDLADSLFTCAHGTKEDSPAVFKQRIAHLVAQGQGTQIFELACRIARNILNGRWLWRNRLAASSIKIQASLSTSGEVLAEVDPYTISFKEFGNYTEAEKKVAEVLARGFEGQRTDTTIQVEADVDFGVLGAEVFPSQKYLSEKGPVSRVLYTAKVRNKGEDLHVAAFRDQKVANALRTYDTWYPDYAKVGRPIPIEPCGADLTDDQFYRGDKASRGTNAYALFLKIDQDNLPAEESLFLLSMLIRGGVFASAASKTEKGDKDAD